MKSYKVLSIAILLSISVNSFAICERERDEYNHFKDLCDKLTASSGVVGLIGAIAIPFVGGLLGGVPGLAAQNACRIMGEKENNLKRCLAKAQTDAQIEFLRQQQRLAQVNNVNAHYDRLRAETEAEFRNGLENFLREMADEGYNLTLPETQEVIRRTREDLRTALHQRLDQLEVQRRRFCTENCVC